MNYYYLFLKELHEDEHLGLQHKTEICMHLRVQLVTIGDGFCVFVPEELMSMIFLYFVHSEGENKME